MAHFMPLALDLEPGKRAGPFVLGDGVRDVLRLLRASPLCDSATQVHIKYDASARTDTDILLDLPRNGVLLRFAHRTQRLIAVEVYSFNAVRLSFSGEVLCDPPPLNTFPVAQSPPPQQQQQPQPQQVMQQEPQQEQRQDDSDVMADSVYFQNGTVDISPSYAESVARATMSQYHVPTFVEIYRLFRPTYPGTYEDMPDGRVLYTLRYPGLSFVFEIPAQWRDLPRTKDHPIEFPDKTSAPVLRVLLTEPNDAAEQASQPPLAAAAAAAEPAPATETEQDSSSSSSSKAKQEVEVRFREGLFFADGTALRFGDSAQDVVAVLGEPDAQYVKPAGQMKGFSSTQGSAAPPQDVFFNYFWCGLDVLLDGTTFTAKKFVLHSNYPHHKDFGRYAKSLWHASTALGAREAPTIDVDATWSTAKRAFLPCTTSGEPLVNSASRAESPFGTTFFHAYEQHRAIFEVMQNDRIATLSIF